MKYLCKDEEVEREELKEALDKFEEAMYAYMETIDLILEFLKQAKRTE